MDYGCGKCELVNPSNWVNYDPYYCFADLSKSTGMFERIVCNYVLCVIPPEERMYVLKDIQRLLKDSGMAYISVRNDKPQWGWGVSKRKTYQGRVQGLPLPLLYKCHGFRIYTLTKDTELV